MSKRLNSKSNFSLILGPPSGLRDCMIWDFWLRESVKLFLFLRERVILNVCVIVKMAFWTRENVKFNLFLREYVILNMSVIVKIPI